MPIKGAKYRFKKNSDVRLALKGDEVVESKNVKTGKIHTKEEFEADKKRVKRNVKK